MAACTCADPMMVAQTISQVGSETNMQLATSNTNLNQIHQTMYGSAMGGIPGSPAPVRFCHWAAPEVTDIGENLWSIAFKAASIAIAIANGIAQAEIADKQQDLAEGYYQQAKFKWDRFSAKYVPLEQKLLNEVSTVTIRTMDCAGAESRARTAVNSAYNSIGQFLTRKASMLRLCVDTTLLSVIDLKQSMMLVDATNYNLADEQWYTDFKNDQRWNRRSNVLNLGRNLSSEALKYGDVARALYGQVGQQIERAASGVIQALGYYGARNDTYYPTTFLSGGSGQLVSIGQSTGANSAISTNPAAG